MGKVFKRPGRSAWHYKVRLANGEWQMRVGYTDKRATEEKQAREQRLIERSEAGLVDPFLATREADLEDLVKQYSKTLRAKARADRYVRGVQQRLELVCQVTGARHIGDLDAQAVEGFLGRLVRGEGLPPMPARPNTEDPVQRGPASMRTRDSYVEALRTFGSWLYATERLGSNPFGRLKKEARESDRTMEHRALSRDEIDRLVQAAEVRGVQQWVRGGPESGGHPQISHEKVAELQERGFARGSLYLFAGYSGLRLNECRQLLRGHLVLEGPEPHVLVRAEHAKARTEKRVPLIAPVVERLRDYLKRRSAAAVRAGGAVPDAASPVFDLPRNLLQTLRKDAVFAGLGLYDDVGRKVTFHGFRASTATLLARAGVSASTAMRVLRHSDANLTLKVYAKLGLADVHRELRERLSPQVAPNVQELRAAVGLSVPPPPNRSAELPRREEAVPSSVVPLRAAQCLSSSDGADEAEMVGRAGFEPAGASGRTADGIGPAEAPPGSVTTGVTKDAGDVFAEAPGDDRLLATIRWVGRALRAAGKPLPLPRDLCAKLRQLLADGAGLALLLTLPWLGARIPAAELHHDYQRCASLPTRAPRPPAPGLGHDPDRSRELGGLLPFGDLRPPIDNRRSAEEQRNRRCTGGRPEPTSAERCSANAAQRRMATGGDRPGDGLARSVAAATAASVTAGETALSLRQRAVGAGLRALDAPLRPGHEKPLKPGRAASDRAVKQSSPRACAAPDGDGTADRRRRQGERPAGVGTRPALAVLRRACARRPATRTRKSIAGSFPSPRVARRSA